MRILSILVLSYCSLIAFSCNAKEANTAIRYKTYSNSATSEIKVITLSPKQFKIIAVRAHAVGQEVATIGVMAEHFKAIAAINGGFFRLNKDSSNWVPAGALKINNHWHGIAYQPRGAVGWNPNTGAMLFDRLQTDSNVIIADKAFPINAMNKLVTGNRAALLSDSFSEPIALSNGRSITILDQKIQAFTSNEITVPADGYLYYVSGDYVDAVKNIKVGDSAIINIKVRPLLHKTTTQQWNKMPYIVGGGPLLIHHGKKITSFKDEKIGKEFLNERTARTAIGVLNNGDVVFVVAEGDVIQKTSGLTIAELRDFMFSLGCVNALNLDGGGSSAMYLRDTLLPTIERPVADAILILTKN